MMDHLFANRTQIVRKSFIREILKVTERPEVISFAGGLPNALLFPVNEIAAAAAKALAQSGPDILQYRTTEGHLPLRELIAERYRTAKGLEIDPSEILMTTGSQQGLDLIGKVFLDKGDRVILERPAYLGAIQALGMYEPSFSVVPLGDEGIDVQALAGECRRSEPKLMYAVPSFQNPSGITYSDATRRAAASILADTNTVFVEDDPYGELRFLGENVPSMRRYLEENTILLGSFSKVMAPGLRIGWVCAKPAVMEKLIVAKQASDLHSDSLAQWIACQYLMDNDLDAHIAKIRQVYKRQRDLMVKLIGEHCPPEVEYTRPEGGMFLWITLPRGISSLELFEIAIKENVAFVPGHPFYVDGGGDRTLRLNYSNSNEERIDEGIRRLAKGMKSLLADRKVDGHGVDI
jgi:2-aminoadipate transaminase